MRKISGFRVPESAPLLWQRSAAEASIRSQDSPLDDDHPILIKDGERCWMLHLSDISLIESEGNYCRLHFGANHAMVYRSLSHLEERLDPAIFLRANRHCVINLRNVKDITPWPNGGFLVRLASGREIEISRRQARRLKHLTSL